MQYVNTDGTKPQDLLMYAYEECMAPFHHNPAASQKCTGIKSDLHMLLRQNFTLKFNKYNAQREEFS